MSSKKTWIRPVLLVPDQPDLVPAVGPGGALRARLGDRDAGLAVHEEDAVGMRVGLLAQVDVVEWLGILISEEEAKVAMAVIARRSSGPSRPATKSSRSTLLRQGDVEGERTGGSYLLCPEQFEDPVVPRSRAR